MKRGMRRGLTGYGDEEFSLFLRKAFIKAMGYTDDALDRPIIGITNTYSGFNACHRTVPELIEAVFLTSLGGVLGILCGSSIGLLVHALSGFPVSLPWWSFAIGIGFSASVGIFFGMFPAIKASRLDPIEALRHE
jgi:ABC-type lipoprotein release transport system permease subunit